MKRIVLSVLLLSTAAGIVKSCTPINAQVAPDYEHVIILGFDGWGASSFNDANMPYLKSLLPNSAWTLRKRSILPSSSACNWASMFKGAGPEAHGYIAWNTQTPAFDITYADKKGNFPSLFSLYREKYPDREMGYLYQWDGMKYIFDMDDFNYTEAFSVSVAGSDKMSDAAISYIKERKPSLAFFVWDYPDATGHSIGWYTDNYMSELAHIDGIISSVVDACVQAGIIENTLLVITSDHGGHDKTHGHPLISDLETPFLLFGKGIKPGEIDEPLMQYDIASILADYMSLKQPIAWRGRTPSNLF